MKKLLLIGLLFILSGCGITLEDRKFICIGKGGEWIGDAKTFKKRYGVCKIDNKFFLVSTGGNFYEVKQWTPI